MTSTRYQSRRVRWNPQRRTYESQPVTQRGDVVITRDGKVFSIQSSRHDPFRAEKDSYTGPYAIEDVADRPKRHRKE